jgi:hypothetical protein
MSQMLEMLTESGNARELVEQLGLGKIDTDDPVVRNMTLLETG